ncbi:uncharacterized protein LOC128394571 [Panonychus citri]|uniref:uncharacterized protein LOC128390063 n=1 Tax=Panonychus citri TaxID=50023 RepID=UPI002307473A|nr:uncharacterized protein LOC128390063 [Panonychus citri]XP_053210880.1 uncharacterized protein LOC128394571 [Panonychus citri]
MSAIDPPLRTPFNVSPFIRFSRWALLISGVAWGIHRQKVNSKTENDYREFIDKMKPIWMENKKRIKAEMTREELVGLAGAINIPVPADFDKQYPSSKDKAPIDPEVLSDVALAAYKKGKGQEILKKAESVKF